jgi:hypothetical protein
MLPILTGIVFLILSLPFVFGILEPSLHGGAYGALYVILNFVPLWITSGLSEAITRILIKGSDLYLSNLVAMGVLLVFWVVVSFLVGIVIDSRNKIPRSD